MKLRIIKTDKDYETLIDWIDTQFDLNIPPDSPQGEKLQIALLLIKKYEDDHYPIPMPDPIEAVKLKMKEMGLKNKDLVDLAGSKGYVSEVLNRKKPLTLKLAKIFHKKLGIPAEILLR